MHWGKDEIYDLPPDDEDDVPLSETLLFLVAMTLLIAIATLPI